MQRFERPSSEIIAKLATVFARVLDADFPSHLNVNAARETDLLTDDELVLFLAASQAIWHSSNARLAQRRRR
jgi:hypothetical protein